MKELVNYMDMAVREALPDLLELRQDICKCEDCQCDIIAYALNQLPPKYVVSERGHIHTKVDFAEIQHDVDVTTVILQGINTVGKRPRHK